MDSSNRWEKRRSLLFPSSSTITAINEDDDEQEQVKKTLNFFDSILDEYLDDDDDEDNPNHQLSHSALNLSQIKSKQIPVFGKSSSNSLAVPPSTRHDQHHHPSTSHVRRYTSEYNLNQLNGSSKENHIPKSHRSSFLQSTATSTEDLPSLLSKKNFSSQTNLPNLNEKVNSSTSVGVSASLIDLTSIDQTTSRPMFRFVPSTSTAHIESSSSTKDEPMGMKNNFNQSHPMIIPSVTSNNNKSPMKHPPNVFKPTVITPTGIPSIPKSAPLIRSNDSQFHHENGVSAFKPLISTKTNSSTKDLSNAKRNEMTSKPPVVHVGLTNPSSMPNGPLLRHVPYHQSMFDLPLNDVKTTNNNNSPNLHPHAHYIRQSTANPSRPTRYYPSAASKAPSFPLTDPLNKWLEQMKDSSAMYVTPPQALNNRPYGYPAAVGSAMNDFDRPSFYKNRKVYGNVAPAQSVYLASPSSAGSVYHFNPTSNNRISSGSKTRQSNSTSSYGPDCILTTYL